jgi:hypothetical protein
MFTGHRHGSVRPVGQIIPAVHPHPWHLLLVGGPTRSGVESRAHRLRPLLAARHPGRAPSGGRDPGTADASERHDRSATAEVAAAATGHDEATGQVMWQVDAESALEPKRQEGVSLRSALTRLKCRPVSLTPVAAPTYPKCGRLAVGTGPWRSTSGDTMPAAWTKAAFQRHDNHLAEVVLESHGRILLSRDMSEAHPGEGKEPLTLVELRGLEPLTPCMPCRCATSCATAPHDFSCGAPVEGTG